jgi:hypothetical protein
MVKRSIGLNEQSSLTFTVNANAWTQVGLVVEDHETFLGAEMLPVLAKKIVSAIDEYKDRDSVGVIDGLPVIAVISLSEKHSSIFLNVAEDGAVFFFQDPDGEKVESISASYAAINELKGFLYALLN